MIKVEKFKIDSPIKNLGRGELSTLYLYKKKNFDAIITDDRKFLSVLSEQKIPFILPSDVITRLVKKKKITVKKSLEALEKLRPLIREDLYKKTKKEIGD